MKTVYSLWDSETNNLVADFDTEAEALGFVAEEIAASGADIATTWGLLREDGAKADLVAQGQDLAKRARKAPLRAS